MRDWSITGRAISLKSVIPEVILAGAEDLLVHACSDHSSSCRPGSLFFAIKGQRSDGHDRVDEAVRQGAVGVVAERPIPGCRVPVALVADPRIALGKMCQAVQGNPSQSIKVIGVTGTNGKTTTVALIASVLEAAGARAGRAGTLGLFDGEDEFPTAHTTPPAPALAEWLGRTAAWGCSHAVMEVSSHALAQHRVVGIEFDAVCVTNVRHDHLDYHKSLAAYRQAKARLLEHLSPSGVAVLNADDPVAAGLAGEADGPVLTVGIDQPAEIAGQIIETFPSEQTFLLSIGSATAAVRTTLIGKHNVANCLQAAAVGAAYGIDLATIVRGIEAVDRVPGRLERLECGQPFSVYVDYAHTPDALASALDAVRAVTRGRVICLFGAGGERDRAKRPRMGREAERRANLLVLTDDNPRGEDPRIILSDILSGLRRPFRAEVIPDRAEAIAFALSAARPGDSVVLAGKGHEDYQITNNFRLPFDDAAVARDWLCRPQTIRLPHAMRVE